MAHATSRRRNAVIEIAKLRDYVLNPLHPRGRHKARVFASTLQIQQADAEFLQQQLYEAAASGVAIRGDCDEYGERYVVDSNVFGDSRARWRPVRGSF